MAVAPLHPNGMEYPVKSQARFWMMVILASASTGAFLLWTTRLIWHRAGAIDRNPSRFGVKSQLMRRKSEAMHDILDELVAGKLGHVHSAANRMERYGETIDGYLASELYDRYGADFHQAVADRTAAAAQDDVNPRGYGKHGVSATWTASHR